MTAFASEAWAAEAAELWPLLPPVPGASGVVSLALSTAPRREVAFHWRYEEGNVVDGAPGVGGGAGPAAAFTIPADEAAVLVSGDLSPSVAFMRGRLKAAGNGGLILDFLASTETDGFERWLSGLSALATE